VTKQTANTLPTLDCLITHLEREGFNWDVGHTGGLIEARVWDWPNVIGRYRPNQVEPVYGMLFQACIAAGVCE
jgi:hypothetical protein